MYLEKLSVRIAIDCCSGEQNESPACSLAARVGSFDGWRSAEDLRASNLGRKNGAADCRDLSAWPEIQRYREPQAGISSAGKLFFVRNNGELGQLTQEQRDQGFEKSAGKEEKGGRQIRSVDVTGKAASVKVVEIYEESTYTDYISLLKLADGWKNREQDFRGGETRRVMCH